MKVRMDRRQGSVLAPMEKVKGRVPREDALTAELSRSGSSELVRAWDHGESENVYDYMNRRSPYMGHKETYHRRSEIAYASNPPPLHS